MRVYLNFDYRSCGIVDLKASELEVLNSVLNRIIPTEYYYNDATLRRRNDPFSFQIHIVKDSMKLIDPEAPAPTNNAE